MFNRGIQHKTAQGAIGILASLILLSFSAIANAQTVSDCEAKIDVLITETKGAELLSKRAEMDRAGLIGKLKNALIKLDELKIGDAIQKVEDYRAKVVQLRDAGKPKISAKSAATLLTGADDVLACLGELQVKALQG